MKFSVFQQTELGARQTNEDRLGYVYTKESVLFVVADGMGGHAHGEIAAQIALESFIASFKRQALPLLRDPYDFLHRVMLQAHHEILNFSQEHDLGDSPRTTLVALIVQDGQAWWAHCGDSRMYWCRGNKMLTRTKDHSYTEQKPLLSLSSRLSAQAMARAVNRNVLFTCLGSPTKPIYDVSKSVNIEPDDRFLLCTDGLWSQLVESELLSILTSHSPDLSINELVKTALLRGGVSSDNVSAIAVQWHQNELRAPTRAIQTLQLMQNDFVSTVQGHLLAGEQNTAQDFDDEAIARSILEINAAIKKSFQ